MKTHTSDFKNAIKTFGRELDSKITYTIGGTTIELGNEQLNSVTPHYEGGILKSVMKQLDIDSNVEIPLGTILTYQFGVKVSNQYEYINFGNYVVYKAEKQEDTNSWQITCYDKMLYAMKDYESLEVTYPITVRNYINALCTKIGLTFKNANSTFANYNKQITKELYLDENGKSLGYTFRDVLDELAQVTASTICINENDDELEIRYINNTNDTIDEEYLKDVNVNFGEKYGPVNTIVLSRSAGADNIYYPSTLPSNPIEIKISDNQIMNGNDRDTYMPDIYNKLNGLEYYINDFSSTGICYYNLCDRYNVSIGEQTYSCVMFNDEINVTQGLEENVYTEMPEESVTDYKKSDTTDRRINQTTLIVDKQQSEITALVDTTEDIQKEINPTDTASGSSIYLEDSTNAELVNFEMEGKTTQETKILPSEYTQVDYITLTGTQYLNTGYKLWNSTTWKIELDFSISENYNYNAIFGFDDVTDINNEVWIYGTGAYAWRACGKSNTNVTSITPNERIVMTHDNNSTGFRIDKNGTNVWNTTQLTGTADHNLCVGHRQGGGWLKGKIYSIKMYSNSAMVRNFIPCYRNSDSVVGLYDLVNDTFYTNSGTGTFAYGNVVNIPSPDYPSELVSVGYENLFDGTLLNGRLNSSGSIIGASGTANKHSNLIKIEPNTNYTYSCSTSVQSGYYYCVWYDETSNFISSFEMSGTSKTAKSPLNAKYISISIYNVENQQVQLTKGTQVHSYIPYGKYGIEVKTIGKNILPTKSEWEFGDISSSNGQNTSSSYYIRTTNYIKINSSTNYYYSSALTNSNSTWNIYQYDENKNYISREFKPNSYTSSNNCRYIRFAIRHNSPLSNITLDDIANDKLMLEKGNQATTYEEYKSKTYLYTLNQPLRSISNTKDLLYIRNGMLYVERKIGSVVLNGSEVGWSNQGGQAPYSLIVDNLKTINSQVMVKSSNFMGVSYSSSWTIYNALVSTSTASASVKLIKFKYVDMATLDDFKSWLSTHNTEVQYILAEPYIEELGQVDIPSTYKGITYIDTTDELEPNMNITYVMNTQITNYVQNQVSQIKITEDGILAEVNRKVDNEEIIAKLNLAIEDEQGIIEITGNQVTIDSDYFKLNADGTIKSTGGTIGGYKITDNMLYAETFAKYNYTENDLAKIRNYLMGTGTLTPEEFIKYDVNESGTVTSLDYVTIKFFIEYNVTPTSSAKIIMQTGNSISDNAYVLQDGVGNEILNIGFNGIYYKDINLANTTTYSENELVVGKWIDNKPIYRKVIDIGNLPNTSQTTVNHNISNIERIVKLYGSATRDSDKDTLPIPYVTFNSNNSGGINLYADNVSVFVSTSSDRSSYTGYVVLEYTKTND